MLGLIWSTTFIIYFYQGGLGPPELLKREGEVAGLVLYGERGKRRN